MAGDRHPKQPPLQPITDFEGKDEETTAQFWSASRLARSDPKLREAIERLAAELGEEAAGASSLLPMDHDRLGGSLQQIYDQGRRDGPAREPHDEVPLSSGPSARENTQPLPETEDPTLAADEDDRPPPPRQRKPPEDGFDEIHPPGGGPRGRREPTDPGGLLGPVDEFTLSLSEDLVKKAQAPIPPPRPRTAPGAEPFNRPPGRDPLTTGVVPAPGPLTTGVVLAPDAAPASVGPGTAALMFDGLDEPRRGALRPSSRPPSKPPERAVRPTVDPESLRLPDVPMPPPDTARARPLQPVEEPVRAPALAREPRPTLSRAPPPSRPPAPASLPPSATPAQVAPNSAAVKRLEELLTLAEEPPEKEETISSSMELLSLADAPPEKEDTIGADLVRVDAPAQASPPSLPSIAEAPPEKEETLSGVMVRVDEPSADDVVLPPAVPADEARQPRTPPASRPPPRPTASAPPRAAPARADTGPLTPLTPAHPLQPIAPPPPSQPDVATRPVERPPPEPARPRTLGSAQLRRETYRPSAPPASVTAAAQAQPAPRAPPARFDADSPPPGAGQDSWLVMAGMFASFLFLGAFVMGVMLLIALIV